MRYIQNMSVSHLSMLVKKAVEQSQRDEVFKLYVSIYPHFTKGKELTFNEFNDMFKPKEKYTTNKSVDEIMNELQNERSE